MSVVELAALALIVFNVVPYRVEAYRTRMRTAFESAREQREEANARLKHERAKAQKQQKFELEDIGTSP